MSTRNCPSCDMQMNEESSDWFECVNCNTKVCKECNVYNKEEDIIVCNGCYEDCMNNTYRRR